MQPHYLARPPVEHRLLGLDRRYLLPTIAVLVLVLFWTVAVPALNESLEAGELTPGTALSVGQGQAVSFAVGEGWVPAAPPFPGSPVVAIFKDGILFVVKAGAFDGGADVLLERLLAQGAYMSVASQRRAFTVPSGLNGYATTITTSAYEEGLFALVGEGMGIEVRVRGSESTLSRSSDELGRMIGTLKFDRAEQSRK